MLNILCFLVAHIVLIPYPTRAVTSTTANADAPPRGNIHMKLTDLHLSRRRMVVMLGGAAVAVGAVLAAPIRSLVEAGANQLANAVSGKRTINLATAGYNDWLAQVGTTFGTSGYNLKLIGIAPLKIGRAHV